MKKQKRVKILLKIPQNQLLPSWEHKNSWITKRSISGDGNDQHNAMNVKEKVGQIVVNLYCSWWSWYFKKKEAAVVYLWFSLFHLRSNLTFLFPIRALYWNSEEEGWCHYSVRQRYHCNEFSDIGRSLPRSSALHHRLWTVQCEHCALGEMHWTLLCIEQMHNTIQTTFKAILAIYGHNFCLP